MFVARRTALLAVFAAFAMPCVSAAATVRLVNAGTASKPTLKNMDRELGVILRKTDLRVVWDSPETAGLGRLVQFELLGRCSSRGPKSASPGPMGWAKVVDGRVLPYIEISCDRVRATIAPELEREVASHRDYHFGRALARVLAHELHHVLTQETAHDFDHALTHNRLSARDLVRGSYSMPAAAFASAPAAPASAEQRPKPLRAVVIREDGSDAEAAR